MRKKQSASGTAGESDGNDWSSEGEDMAASGGGGDSNQKQKRKRKKKKKSSVQQPPQENKLDKPLELDIFVVSRNNIATKYRFDHDKYVL